MVMTSLLHNAVIMVYFFTLKFTLAYDQFRVGDSPRSMMAGSLDTWMPNALKNSTNPFSWTQFGTPRTATTLQFQTLCFAMITKILSIEPSALQDIHCHTPNGTINDEWGKSILGEMGVVKTHEQLPANNAQWKGRVVFATSSSGSAQKVYNNLRNAGFVVPYVADTQMVAKRGPFSVYEYQDALEMNDEEMSVLAEFIRFWDILRQCCGKQMSADWRNSLHPMPGYRVHHSTHDAAYGACAMYNISKVEDAVRSTILYRAVVPHDHLRKMLRPSQIDDDLDGKYCEWYNDKVRATGLKFNQKTEKKREERSKEKKAKPKKNAAPKENTAKH